ncbi:MAG: MmgE/PrpD family protein, partial [bacterium]
TLEAVVDLKREHGFRVEDVTRVDVETFDVAYHIIGGGEEGDKIAIRTKEEADHSLPYMVAAAMLDGQVMPEQYRPDRIVRGDVQALLRKVIVRPSDEYSRRFPQRMACRVTITLTDGRTLVKDKDDYEGFHTRPMQWDAAVAKFERLSAPYADAGLRREIVHAAAALEGIRVADLMRLVSRVSASARG